MLSDLNSRGFAALLCVFIGAAVLLWIAVRDRLLRRRADQSHRRPEPTATTNTHDHLTLLQEEAEGRELKLKAEFQKEVDSLRAEISSLAVQLALVRAQGLRSTDSEAIEQTQGTDSESATALEPNSPESDEVPQELGVDRIIDAPVRDAKRREQYRPMKHLVAVPRGWVRVPDPLPSDSAKAPDGVVPVDILIRKPVGYRLTLGFHDLSQEDEE